MPHPYQVIAYYRKRGRYSPAFPSFAGWTFLGLNKATPEGDKEATYGGDGTTVATIVEALHTFLQEASEKGEIEPSFSVKLFQHVAALADADAPAQAKKKGWMNFF
jgi:hypothetical protein